MRWRLLLAAGALVLGGCGGAEEPAEPSLPAPLAADLAARSDAVAAAFTRGDACSADAAAARLQQAVIAAVNAGDVPPELQEDLTGAANALAERLTCPPPPPPPPTVAEGADDQEEDEGEGRGKGDGKDKDKGKGEDKGKGNGD